MRAFASLFVCLLACAASAPVRAQTPALVPHEEVSNWGVWGAEDQRGAANFITPETVVAAARLIKTGKTFSLAIPLDATGPVFPGRLAPHHTMVFTGTDYAAGVTGAFGVSGAIKFTDDYMYMALQGSTQWDALSHAWYGNQLYNGVPETAIRSAPMAGGATRLGIENVKDSLVGRAVLIDIARAKGGQLPLGYGITRKDIVETLVKQGAEVKPGDMVLLRTGYVPAFYEIQDPIERARYLAGPHTGITRDVIGWIKSAKIAGIAADNLAVEKMPNDQDAAAGAPLHGNLLRDMGVYIGEIWWLEELAADCAKDGRYEFFLAAQPLNITGAVGTPLNPVAIK